MIDITDVGLIDPHAKGDRGHHDSLLGCDEPLLGLASQIVFHAGVISPGIEHPRDELPSDFFRRPLQRNVDDRGSRFPLGQGGEELFMRRAAVTGVPSRVRFGR